jgi:putative nucleotidyltransferase with HDIG domain
LAKKPTYEELEQLVKELEIQAQQLTVKLAEANEVLQKVMADGKKESIIEKILSSFKSGEIALPSLPQINIKFNEMVDKGANLEEVGDLLKQDVSISSKLISVANSAYYGGASETKTLAQAVGRLGLATTKQYVDAICNIALYATSNKKFVERLKPLWQHSLSCAYASKIVCEMINLKPRDDAFTMGLLHDIGKLVLLQVVAELEIQGKLDKDVDSVELSETLEKHHGKIGAILLKKWGFSVGYAQIAMYHDAIKEADPISKELLLVHFANLLVKSMDNSQSPQSGSDVENAESARLLKIDSTMIDDAKGKVKECVEEMAGILT